MLSVELLMLIGGIYIKEIEVVVIFMILLIATFLIWKFTLKFPNKNKTYKETISDLIYVYNTLKISHEKENLTPLKAKQIFESIYLIESTKRIDILVSNYNFLCNLSNSTIISNTALKKGLDIYKKMYYDREVILTQSKIINENNFLMFNQEYLDSQILNCFFRFAAFQEFEMNNLKTKKAKANRVFKIQEHAEVCINNCKNQEYIETIKKRVKDFDI